MKTLLLSLSLVCSASAQNVAIWFYGPNTNGIATNFPSRVQDIGTNLYWFGADMVTSVSNFLALKNQTVGTLKTYLGTIEADRLAILKARLTAWNVAVTRLEDWQSYLGTPTNPGSNFVNIAQASQWAREVTWLQKRLLQISAPQYKPEDDTLP